MAGVSSRDPHVRAALAKSLARNTLKHYNGYLARFAAFCHELGLGSWRDASTDHVLSFLAALAEGVGRPGPTLDAAIPALRLAFFAAQVSPLDSPLVARLRKGLIADTLRVRAVTEPLPVLPLVRWLRTMPDTPHLSVQQLRVKCAALAAVVLIARPSDLTCVALDGIEFADDLSTMTVSLLAFKNDYHRDGAVLSVQACSEPKLCLVRAAHRLVREVRRRWPRASHLFVSDNDGKPLKAASVSRLLKSACEAAGMGERFSARNFRPGGATRGLAAGLPLDLVMHIGRWRDCNTVYDHYLRSSPGVNTTDALLGVDPRALDAT
jgi:hypothetical protein